MSDAVLGTGREAVGNKRCPDITHCLLGEADSEQIMAISDWDEFHEGNKTGGWFREYLVG